MQGQSFAADDDHTAVARPVRDTCPDKSGLEFYFAAGRLERDASDAFVRKWYSSNLRAMDERSLSCGWLEAEEVYRILYLPTGGNPVAIRAARVKAHHRIVAIQLDGAGGYHPGHVKRARQREIDPDEWAKMLQVVRSVNFWRTPTGSPRLDKAVLDGETWILEGRKERSHHVLSWNYPDDDAYRDLWLHFLRVSGLQRDGPRH